MILKSIFRGILTGFLWILLDFMGFFNHLSRFLGFWDSLGFLKVIGDFWDSFDILIDFSRDSYGILMDSLGFLWILWDFLTISRDSSRILWDS